MEMKVLEILRSEPSERVKEIIEVHKKEADVEIFELYKNKDYAQLVDKIFEADKVISWW
jgi:Mg/Co/Ni transporter MgtE